MLELPVNHETNIHKLKTNCLFKKLTINRNISGCAQDSGEPAQVGPRQAKREVPHNLRCGRHRVQEAPHIRRPHGPDDEAAVRRLQYRGGVRPQLRRQRQGSCIGDRRR